MSSPRLALPAEAEASLRENLRQQIEGAQADLESNIEELSRAAMAGGDAAPLAQAQAQLLGLGRLQQRLSGADGVSLATIRAEVAASVAATQMFVQQVRSVVASAQAAEIALHAASAAAHKETAAFINDFYEKKIFDPYLEFTSAEDEAAYRKREADRRDAIDKAMAEGTPEGNLRANRLAIEQLKDAGAHGADRSADYQPTLDSLRRTEKALAVQVAPPTKMQATATPAADPLDALNGPVAIDPIVLAQIRGTGVVVADQTQSGHGVARQEVAASQSSVRT